MGLVQIAGAHQRLDVGEDLADGGKIGWQLRVALQVIRAVGGVFGGEGSKGGLQLVKIGDRLFRCALPVRNSVCL